jgi:hypothetical protein
MFVSLLGIITVTSFVVHLFVPTNAVLLARSTSIIVALNRMAERLADAIPQQAACRLVVHEIKNDSGILHFGRATDAVAAVATVVGTNK